MPPPRESESCSHAEPGPEQNQNQEPVPLPITGELDLHTFRPREIKDLLPDYLDACREKNILTVRVVHGKGTGQLRETVHTLLRRNPCVESFQLAGEALGGWGATMVRLKPLGCLDLKNEGTGERAKS